MKNSLRLILWLVPLALFTLNFQRFTACAGEATLPASDARPGTATLKSGGPHNTQTIPWAQIGAKASADYHGDGLAMMPTPEGARLHCVFQRLEGEVTAGGLWLTSTLTNQILDRFQVRAASVGRVATTSPLPETGTVSVAGQTVRFERSGLVEEYEVSMDGVRQDFVVTERPAGEGQLKVQLAVSGARVEARANGAQLVLEQSARKIAYSRLHATDANGKELPAWIETEPNAALRTPHSAFGLAVIVSDADAVYPVRIDPTFSDANWISMGGVNGTDGNVYAAVMDGSGNLYIGGKFTVVGNLIANNIAQWNGNSWSPLGSGLDDQVSALAVWGTNLYVGGSFTLATNIGNAPVAVNGIAQWNGNSWSPLGLGVGGPYPPVPTVEALAVSGTHLYAGGCFTTATNSGNVPVIVNSIAQWNGSGWSPLGPGMEGAPFACVYALVVSGTNLYAGGQFTNAGGNAANYIAQWNGSSWSPLGAGMNGSMNYATVFALAVLGTNLYAGGQFTNAGGNAAYNIAQWNGSSWLPLGSGMNSTVHSLAVSGNTLYAGGSFTASFDYSQTLADVAQWNGNSWSPLDAGMNDNVWTLAVSGTNFYAGGNFTTAGGTGANNIAQWNGNSWSQLGGGTAGFSPPALVYAVAASGSNVYLGGAFTTAGGHAGNCIVQWNGSSWSALGSGMGAAPFNSLFVEALAVSGTNLYAGGRFESAGGTGANNIAQWNGNSWSPLGLGIGGPYPTVEALAVSGTSLYVGGSFTNAGNTAANNIAQWNGSGWSPLGAGIGGASSTVYALAVSGTNLYVGGSFTNAGNTAANNIAQWNGSGWSPLGAGIGGASSTVYALAVSGANLYAGGWFTMAGGSVVNNLAQWNGNSWSPLGSGVNSDVLALAVAGTNLYAGGVFTTAGGTAANYLAQWNGNSWSPLGSGVNSDVVALAVSGGTLYAGGYFTTAGGKVSAYAAKATIGPPTILAQPQSTNVMAGANANFAVGADGQPLFYQWFKNGNGLSNGGNVSGVTSSSLWLTNVYVNDPGCYLVVVTNNFGGVTSSVATLTVSNLPLVLPGGQCNLGCTNQQFWMTVAGPAGSKVILYASTNLQTWVPLATNPLSLGSLTFTDLWGTNYPGRFYRAKLSP